MPKIALEIENCSQCPSMIETITGLQTDGIECQIGTAKM
jgi:hypothetical protein